MTKRTTDQENRFVTSSLTVALGLSDLVPFMSRVKETSRTVLKRRCVQHGKLGHSPLLRAARQAGTLTVVACSTASLDTHRCCVQHGKLGHSPLLRAARQAWTLTIVACSTASWDTHRCCVQHGKLGHSPLLRAAIPASRYW